MPRPRRPLLVTIIAAALLCGLQAGAGPRAFAAGAKWSYSGSTAPQRWGDLSPEYAACKTGKEQTPIDITHAEPADLAPIAFDYKPSPLTIVDNGHTIQVNYAPGSGITVGGTRYELVQFHFHKPGEEKIHGKAFAMDIHLVHRAANGALAVVGVLLAKGQANPLIKTLWAHLPKTRNKETVAPTVTIDAAQLLPGERGYYTFAGSLTTPPCSEHVTWFLLRHPVEVSGSQVAAFGKRYPMNARPVQPVHDRIIKVTK